MWSRVALGFAGLAVAALLLPMPSATERAAAEDGTAARWKSRSHVKTLSRDVERGLKWLVDHQREDGSWDAGESVVVTAATRRVRSPRKGAAPRTRAVTGPASLGDTCVATLALVRAGSTPTSGPHAGAVMKAFQFVLSEVENAPETGLLVTSRTGSRIQSKLGPNVDTFLTSLLLAELRGRTGSGAAEAMLDRSMGKILAKMERHQQPDGTFGKTGWAKALAEALAGKGVNRYAQAGGIVSEVVRERLENAARNRFDGRYGKFGGAGSAGVNLYAAASTLSILQDSANTNSTMMDEVRRRSESRRSTTRPSAKQTLDRFRATARELRTARQSVVSLTGNRQFVAGFGSAGGEEYLSYLCIGESLLAGGGGSWSQWDRQMSRDLGKTQNSDGSWSGRHCITGRTFCTSAALLTLMADRTPIPVSVTYTERVK